MFKVFSHVHFRLIVPRLKRRGVTVETELEYRVGAYFVLATNVKSIDWVKLMKYSRKDRELRQQTWREEKVRRDKLREGTADGDKEDEKRPSKINRLKQLFQRVWQITMFEVIANCLAWLDYLPYVISVPFCWIMYHCFLKATMKIYILSTAADSKFFAGHGTAIHSSLTHTVLLVLRSSTRNFCLRRRKRNGDGHWCQASAVSSCLYARSTTGAARRQS